MSAAPSPIGLHIDGSIAVATLARPPVNAIDDVWVARLDAVVDEIEARDDVRVLWLRSAGRVFCAGADLALMRERFASADRRAGMVALTRAMQRVFARIERSPRVSIAELGGAALGGGLELALACDIRIAAESAKLGLPEAGLGLLPGAGGTQRLARICGDAVARQLILPRSSMAGAPRRLAWCSTACHWPNCRTPRAQAERIAAVPAATLAACKRCITAAVDGAEDGYEAEVEGTAMLYAHPPTQALVRSFLGS